MGSYLCCVNIQNICRLFSGVNVVRSTICSALTLVCVVTCDVVLCWLIIGSNRRPSSGVDVVRSMTCR